MKGGGLDLLDDDARSAANSFSESYVALRRREGWVGPTGREDPAAGEPRLWRGRIATMSEAAAALSRAVPDAGRRIVVDVGSGGGWAARYLGDCDVIAVDLLEVEGSDAALYVRADMRGLPLGDETVDAALYVASIHYAPIEESIREASRVLRPRGALIVVDSPMYLDRVAQAEASKRSAAYYASAGFPQLGSHYYPIDVTALRAALVASQFRILRMETGSTASRWWQRFGRPRRPSFLFATSKRGNA
jgi:SAM-dependent methyltransferase